MGNSLIRITDLAKQTGCASSALRYYEEQGLLEPDARSEVGYRLYASGAAGRVAFIQRAKSLGLSLREIRQLLQEPPDDAGAKKRIRHAIAHKLADTQSRIAELETLRSELDALSHRLGDESLPSCGHIGDCECWLPTTKEVQQMAIAVSNTEGCDCCGCDCPCDSTCSCCGCARA